MRRGEFLFSLAIASSVILAFGCLFARADDEHWLPKSNHYDSVIQGANCGIVRLLETRLKQQVDESRKMLVDQKNTLKQKRRELEACGKNKGITLASSDTDETLLAEVCPDAYESWISPSYRFHMLFQDLEDAKSALSQAKNQLRDGCSPLPKKSWEPVLGQLTKLN